MVKILSFDESPPGLNGSKGLMRMHWAARKKVQQKWDLMMLEKRFSFDQIHEFPVRIIYIRRWCGMPMDWDNAAASIKIPLDAMVKAKMLPDDSPEYISEFVIRQERVENRKKTGIDIIIQGI